VHGLDHLPGQPHDPSYGFDALPHLELPFPGRDGLQLQQVVQEQSLRPRQGTVTSPRCPSTNLDGLSFREKPYGTSTETLAGQLKLLFQLIFDNRDNIPERNYSRLQDILDYNDYTIEEVMSKLAPRCDHLLQRCKWKGEEKRCESLFETIKTTEGFCCAFNYYALKNHTFGG
jgi:hypothetical protein